MSAPEVASLDEVSRLLALLVRLQLGNQTQAILELNRVGIGPTRIADLLGTTAGTARVTVHQSRQRLAANDNRKGTGRE